jgi:hypothetical protein
MKLSTVKLSFEGHDGAYWQSSLLSQKLLPLYDAFAKSFPSLPLLERERIAEVSMSAATILYGARDPYRDFQTMRKVMRQLDDSSCDGEWPAMIYIADKKCEIVPYVGDRTMIIQWGEHNLQVTFDMRKRPSHVAIYPVIEEVFSLGPDGDYKFMQAADENGNVPVASIIHDFKEYRHEA